MRAQENRVIWACDVCGNTETRIDGVPPGWICVVYGTPREQLGNKPDKDLCRDCADSFGRLMSNTLGDTGDMGEAWDEGYRSGKSNAMRRMSDEPNAPTTPNPYRQKLIDAECSACLGTGCEECDSPR